MAQCSAGSRAQAAAPAYFWLTWKAFQIWIGTRLAGVAGVIWSFFSDQPFDVAEFCATEPDIRAAPSLAQWLLFFSLSPVDRVYVEGYLLDCFKAFLWPNYCECIPTGAPYTCTTWRGHPDNSGWSGGAAHDYSFGVQFFPTADVTCYGMWLRVTTVGTGLCQFGVWESGGANLQYVQPVVPSTSDAKYFFPTPQLLLAGHQYFIFYQFPGTGWSQSQKNVNSTPFSTSYGSFGECVIRSPISSSWTVHSNATDSPDPLFCAPPDTYFPPDPVAPVGLPDYVAPTCSTTADICSRIDTLQSLILETRTALYWLQSVQAPVCWAPGTVASGLTGAGTIAVSHIIGAYVTLTYPASWGKTSDTPARLVPKVGELFALVDGVQAFEEPLHFAAQQIINLPPSTNQLAYSLRPGVTADIVPLVPCK